MPDLTVVYRILAAAGGITLVAGTVLSAIMTFVLPRASNTPITQFVFGVVQRLFRLVIRRAGSYRERDRVMALYAPVALLVLPAVWLTLITFGYAALYYALGEDSWYRAFQISGSSALTLGFANADDLPRTILEFTEATLGLIMVAILIAYLPTMYSAFSKRESAVTMLEVRAGSPPSALVMIIRYHRIHGLNTLGDLWATWETWFAELEESHTSLAALVFFRSPQPERSWLTAAGAILDGAALVNAVVDTPHDARADLCIRAGYLALRRISDFFHVAYNPVPHFGDPIGITHGEFDAACNELAEAGVALKADREKAWRDFAGWRVNYDDTLRMLATLVMAPFAPWSSDRALSPRFVPNRSR